MDKRKFRKRYAQNDEEIEGCSSAKSSKTISIFGLNDEIAHPEEEDQRCGKILRVHLINFMCHANLTINLNKRINFIVGSNGSGKSSIMAAIVIGLGGTPKASSRCKFLKDLIQKGKSSAKIEIVLYNGGPEAYEYETYGNAITVVRNLYPSSTSYVIKNEHGRVVSRKVADLNGILLFHNLQPGNPCFIMTQENTRNFLKNMQPETNFKLFLKATQIELITEKLMECHKNHEQQLFNLNCLQEQIERSENEIKEIKSQISKLQSLEKLKVNLETKKIEYYWALVNEKHAELLEKQRNGDLMQKERGEIEQSLNNREQGRTELQQAISSLEIKRQQQENKCGQVSQEKKELERALNDKFFQSNSIKREVEDHKSQLKRIEDQIMDFKQHIKERIGCDPKEAEEKIKRDNTAKEELKNKITRLLATKENTEKDFNALSQKLFEKENQLKELKQEQTYCTNKIENLRAEMRKTTEHQKNKICYYGDHLPQMLQQIQAAYNQGKFKELPRGPIGSCLNVKDMVFCEIIENYLRSLLPAFIVSCSADREALQKIFNGFHNYHPPIITTDFVKNVYDTRARRVIPPDGTRLLMNEIKCNDPVVINCLIDQKNIETVLLTKLKTTAEKYTSYQENVPKHLSRVLTQSPPMEVFPDPMYRMYTLDVRPARFLQQNIKDLLRIMQENIGNDELKIDLNETTIKKVYKELDEIRKLINQKRADISKNLSRQSDLENELLELNRIEYPNFSGIDILNKELKNDEINFERVRTVLDMKSETLQVLNAELKIISKKLEEKSASYNFMQEDIQKLTNEVRSLNTKLTKFDDIFLQKNSKIKELDNKIHHIKAEIDKLMVELQTLENNAKEKGSRVEISGTADEIKNAIKMLNATINQYKLLHQTEDINQLRDSLKIKKDLHFKDQHNYEAFTLSVKLLEQSLSERFHFVKKLRLHMSILAQFTFEHILKVRNFHGSIEFDFKAKKLDLSVVPRQVEGQRCVSSTRALSGGERSYSTVAFLLALWSCVDHPFFFLDEYDVFTDEVNRKIMTHLLLSEGRKRPNRQYVFLTPLDMNLESDSNLKIHRLAKPKM